MGARLPALSLEILRDKRAQSAAFLRAERTAAQAVLQRQQSLPGALEIAQRAAERDIRMVENAVRDSCRLLAVQLQAEHQARVEAHKRRPSANPNPAKLPRVVAVGGQRWP
jgi:hypothetical protein